MEALVPHPTWDLIINSRNVSRSLDPFVMSITYTDNEEGEADTIDISLDDSDGRFIGPWYPTKGDTLDLRLGYTGQPLLVCGQFEVDEIGYDGPPDIMTLRAIAAGVKEPRRTRHAKAYENTSLKGLAEAVAKRAKLTLVGEIEAIPIRRITQAHEHDLEFLRRVGNDYGYAFSVKGKQLVFFKRSALASAAPIMTLTRHDFRPYSFKDKIKDVAQEAEVSYHDPKSKKVKRHKSKATGETSADAVRLNVRAESGSQAKAKADAALEAANREATTFSGTCSGDTRLVAGINFTLREYGKLSGVYHIKSSGHTMHRQGGYQVRVETRRVSDG